MWDRRPTGSAVNLDPAAEGRLGQKALRGHGGAPAGHGDPESLRLHRLPGRGRGSVSRLEQRGVPPASGFQAGRGISELRLQIRPLVQHDLDGKDHRGALAAAAAGQIPGRLIRRRGPYRLLRHWTYPLGHPRRSQPHQRASPRQRQLGERRIRRGGVSGGGGP